MIFEWDEAKNAINHFKHGLRFNAVHDFDWEDTCIFDRTRSHEGEKRYAAIGWYDERLHTIIFTKRSNVTRIISMRRSNKNEEMTYEKNKS
jgi:uncharacterized protein